MFVILKVKFVNMLMVHERHCTRKLVFGLSKDIRISTTHALVFVVTHHHRRSCKMVRIMPAWCTYPILLFKMAIQWHYSHARATCYGCRSDMVCNEPVCACSCYQYKSVFSYCQMITCPSLAQDTILLAWWLKHASRTLSEWPSNDHSCK